MSITATTLSDGFNIANPGADTNILATALTPPVDGFFIVKVVLATGSVFNYTETRGGTTFTVGLNNSVACDAGDGYTFAFPVSASSTYNFQVETGGAIRVLHVMHSQNAVECNAQGFQA